MYNVDFIKDLKPDLHAETQTGGIRISADYGIRYNEKTFSYIFSETLRIFNDGDEKISYVKYSRFFYDENDKLLTDTWNVYYGNDRSLDKGSYADLKNGFQTRLEGRPVKVLLKIEEIRNIAEYPLIHLPLPGEYLYQALNDENLSCLRKPVKISVGFAYGGSIIFKEREDEQIISEVLEAFSKIRVVAEANIMVTDNDNSIGFLYDDGSQSLVRFNAQNLELYINHHYFIYSLSGHEALFNLMAAIAGVYNRRGVF